MSWFQQRVFHERLVVAAVFLGLAVAACELRTQNTEIADDKEVHFKDVVTQENAFEIVEAEEGYDEGFPGGESSKRPIAHEDARNLLPQSVTVEAELSPVSEGFQVVLKTPAGELTAVEGTFREVELFLATSPAAGHAPDNLIKVETEITERVKNPWTSPVLKPRRVYYAFVYVGVHQSSQDGTMIAFKNAKALIKRIRIDLRGKLIP